MDNKFYGAILVLNTTPDNDTLDAISRDVANEHLRTDSYTYRLSQTLPDNAPVDVVDQYTAQMRDLPKGTYLIISPVEESK